METDKLVAASLQELPHSDRGDVLDDIHGVSQVIEESSTFLKERLLAFDRIINGKKRNRLNWRAYNIAESISKEYVENPAFRLQFLRSTSFDGDKAADRLADHFEEKLELFGESKLAKKISIEDMNSAAAMEGLRSGYLQRFPSRDSAGRAVFCVYRALRPESLDVLSRVRSRMVYWIYVSLQSNLTLTHSRLSIPSETHFMVHDNEDCRRRRNSKERHCICLVLHRQTILFL